MHPETLLSCLVVVGSLGCGSGPADESAPTEPTDPPQSAGGASMSEYGADEIATMRRALSGATLSDDEVVFLHESLRRSGTDYTENGLLTLAEWELTAQVTNVPGTYQLFVSGPQVNAEWGLDIERSTGTVTVGMIATLAEEPEPNPISDDGDPGLQPIDE